VKSADIAGIASSSAHIKAARQGDSSKAGLAGQGAPQSLAQRKALVVTVGNQGIPELHVRRIHDDVQKSAQNKAHVITSKARQGDAKEEGDDAKAMETLRNMRADAVQKNPGHFETFQGGSKKGEICFVFQGHVWL
jgi:hypothetical protein